MKKTNYKPKSSLNGKQTFWKENPAKKKKTKENADFVK